jgi:hypothetical protein
MRTKSKSPDVLDVDVVPAWPSDLGACHQPNRSERNQALEAVELLAPSSLSIMSNP